MTTPFEAALADADPEEVESGETVIDASDAVEADMPDPEPVDDGLTLVTDPNNPKG